MTAAGFCIRKRTLRNVFPKVLILELFLFLDMIPAKIKICIEQKFVLHEHTCSCKSSFRSVQILFFTGSTIFNTRIFDIIPRKLLRYFTSLFTTQNLIHGCSAAHPKPIKTKPTAAVLTVALLPLIKTIHTPAAVGKNIHTPDAVK